MKTLRLLIYLTAFLIGTTCGFGQLNKQVSKKQVSKTKMSNLKVAAPMKKLQERNFKNKLAKDIKKSKVTEMRVPASYLNKPRKKSWKITPAKAFGAGNLGFTLYSGQLRRENFILTKDFIGTEPIAFVGHLSFDAQKDRTYLVRVTSSGPADGSYINAVASDNGTLKVYKQNGAFPILLVAQESGKMLVAISALHKRGGSERYPSPLPIKEIVIDEL